MRIAQEGHQIKQGLDQIRANLRIRTKLFPIADRPTQRILLP